MFFIHLFLFIIYFIIPVIAILYYRTYYLDAVEDKFFFLWGFLLKVLGAIFVVLIYTQYYEGGDTTLYHSTGCALQDYVFAYPSKFIEVLLSNDMRNFNDYNYLPYAKEIVYGKDRFTFTIVKISMLINILTFKSFFLTSILCSYFSFFASWKFYKFISEKSIYFKRQIGYAIFFMPSVVFWGSGLFKDTFTLAAIFLLFTALVSFLGYKIYKVSYIFYIFIGFYLLNNIRGFFILAILPFIIIWIFSIRYSKIEQASIKLVFVPIFVAMAMFSAYFVISFLSTNLQELSLENLQDRSKGFQNWHTVLKGSAYSLGAIDYSFTGLLIKIPAAINVTFFRPYIWETNKPIIFLSFLQSTIFMFITIYTLLKMKIIYFFIHIVKTPIGASLFLFSLFFAFIVGFTSYNFGALDRYKIPCLSTFIISLIFIYESYYKERILFSNLNSTNLKVNVK